MKKNRLTFLNYTGEKKNSSRLALFSCSCGKSIVKEASKVKANQIRSCGCLVKEYMQRGLKKPMTPIKRCYYAMIDRCYNVNSPMYYLYGARGIEVCQRWRNGFDYFEKDMSPRPSGMSLDRIDVNKGYSKNNCRWATPRQQANNRRDNVRLTCYGVTLTIAEWARVLEINYDKLYNRYRRNDLTTQEILFPDKNQKT